MKDAGSASFKPAGYASEDHPKNSTPNPYTWRAAPSRVMLQIISNYAQRAMFMLPFPALLSLTVLVVEVGVLIACSRPSCAGSRCQRLR